MTEVLNALVFKKFLNENDFHEKRWSLYLLRSCSKYYSDIYVNNNDNNNDTKNSFIFVRGTRPYIQNASPLFNCQLFRICVFDVWFNNQSMFAIIWALKKIIINFFFCPLVEWPYFLICSCISWVTLMYPALIYFFLWVLQLLNKKISTTDNLSEFTT